MYYCIYNSEYIIVQYHVSPSSFLFSRLWLFYLPLPYHFHHFYTGIGSANGSIWRSQRRFTLSTFRDFGIGKTRFQDNVAEEAHCLTDELLSRGANNSPLDLKQVLTNAISNVICSVVFGKRFQYSDKDFHRLLDTLEEMMKISGSGGLKRILPIISKFDFKTKRRLRDIRVILRGTIRKIIDEHKARFDPNNVSDYIDVYLRELGQGGSFEAENLDEVSLEKTVIQLFIAGTETTVNTLRWALLYMMKNPDIQNRVQREIDEVAGRNRLPRTSDKMPYVEATLMEVQRIASIVPLGKVYMINTKAEKYIFLSHIDISQKGTQFTGHFYSNRVVESWNKLPENITSTPSVVTFNIRLRILRRAGLIDQASK